MRTHEQFADELALYALNELHGGELQEFEQHLETCASCRRELQAMRSDLGLLGLSAVGPRPPARSKERLMRAIAAEPRGVAAPATRCDFRPPKLLAGMDSGGHCAGGDRLRPQPAAEQPEPARPACRVAQPL